MTNFPLLTSIFLYLLPIALLFYMAVELFLRDRSVLNRLSSAIFLTMMLMMLGSFLTSFLPADLYVPLTVWLTMMPAFFLYGLLLHFSIRLTDRYAHWSFRRVLIVSYSLVLCSPLLLLPFDSIYIQVVDKGLWKYGEPSITILAIIIVPAIYAMLTCSLLLYQGYKEVKRNNNRQKIKQIRLILHGIVIGAILCIGLAFLNPYLAFTNMVKYPEPSYIGSLYFALVIRHVIRKYEFLPSVQLRYKILFDNSPSAILLVDEKMRIREANPAAEKLFGVFRDHLIQMSSGQLLKPYTGAISSRTFKGELWSTKFPAERERIVKAEKESVYSGGENYEYLLLNDITDNIRAEEQIVYMAYHDPLTRLGNRRSFQEAIERLMKEKHEADLNIAVVLMDLDRFKQINDTKGHHVGDLLLQHVADILQERSGFPELIARMGGDEFALLYHPVSSDREMLDICHQIMAGFEDPFLYEDESLYITASIGVSLITTDPCTPELILQYADIAMYEAKHRGRNTIAFFNETLRGGYERKQWLENEMKHALHDGQFTVHMQPLVDLSTGSVCGAEALVRWIELNGNVIYPCEFIPLAIDNGLIIPLGQWVLRQACRFGKEWIEQGKPEIPISVNFSERELLHPSWFEMVETVLDETGFPPRLLHLDIIENTAGAKDPIIQQLYGKIQDKGIRLTIDDFGTGNSTYFLFHAQGFKIDRSIIREIEVNPKALQIIQSLIAMAHSLNLSVTAEGVETAQQLELLKKLGCDAGQGFWFSKPLPMEQFAEWWSRKG